MSFWRQSAPSFHRALKELAGDTLLGATVIYTGHMTPSAVTQFLHPLLGLGVEHIVTAGKAFSETPQAVADSKNFNYNAPPIVTAPQYEDEQEIFYERAIQDTMAETDPTKRIIVYSEGGTPLSLSMKHANGRNNIAGVEHTTRGITHLYEKETLLRFPVHSMAGSALKRNLEAIIVAETIASYLGNKVYMSEGIGIIGHGGSIGGALAHRLAGTVRSLSGFNMVSTPLPSTTAGRYEQKLDIHELITDATVIICCTGGDLFRSLSPEFIKELQAGKHGPKIFINAASADELLTLVRATQSPEAEPFHDITSGSITIPCGGFPVNLVRAAQGEHETYDDPELFELTRRLSLVSTVQAALSLDCEEYRSNIYRISPMLQQLVLDSLNARLLRLLGRHIPPEDNWLRSESIGVTLPTEMLSEPAPRAHP